MSALLEAASLSKTFFSEHNALPAVCNVGFSVAPGECLGLAGASGCGKSTLAAVAAGLYPENGGFLEGGTIRLYGQDLKTLDPQKRAAYLTVLFQNLQKMNLLCIWFVIIPNVFCVAVV